MTCDDVYVVITPCSKLKLKFAYEIGAYRQGRGGYVLDEEIMDAIAKGMITITKYTGLLCS